MPPLRHDLLSAQLGILEGVLEVHPVTLSRLLIPCWYFCSLQGRKQIFFFSF